jgi:hypothetical protein
MAWALSWAISQAAGTQMPLLLALLALDGSLLRGKDQRIRQDRPAQRVAALLPSS